MPTRQILSARRAQVTRSGCVGRTVVGQDFIVGETLSREEQTTSIRCLHRQETFSHAEHL